MKHAAVCAGLGSLGKNTLLINREHGNMLTLGAVLTDADLESDPLSEDLCLNGCTRCLGGCPGSALNGRRADQMRCRPNTYVTNARGVDVTTCNRCRFVCPMRFGSANTA